VETIAEKKIAGMKVGNIYFDYDKFELKPQEKEELNQAFKRGAVRVKAQLPLIVRLNPKVIFSGVQEVTLVIQRPC
jgi:hypothetical protein